MRPRSLASLDRRLRVAAVGLVAAVLAPAGCDDLPRLDENTCGNRVVEEDYGEDCDGQDDCAKPSTQHACHYLCDAKGGCPTGYGCGADGVCRRPKGAFEPLVTKTLPTTIDFLAGDVNADRCAEVVATTWNGTVVTSFASRQAGLCAAAEQTFASHPQPPNEALHPSPFLVDFGGNARPELIVPADAVHGVGLRVYSSDASTALVPLAFPTELIPEAGARVLKVHANGSDKLLLFLGDEIEPVSDETDMPTCMLDGGVPDGGMMMPDGGMMMPDGGLPPPPDGGMLPPPDGGLPPPPDGGLPPAPHHPRATSTVRVAAIEYSGAPTRTLVDALQGGGMNDIATVVAHDLDGDGCDEVIVAYKGKPELHVFSVCGGGKELVFDAYAKAPVLTLEGANMRKQNASIAFGDINGDKQIDVVTNGDDCSAHAAYGRSGGQLGSTPGSADAKLAVFQLPSTEDAQMVASPNSVIAVGRFDEKAPGAVVIARMCPPSSKFESDVCDPIPGDCELVVADIDKDGFDDAVNTEGQQPGLKVSRAVGTGMGFHNSSLDTECPPHNLVAGDFDDDGVNDVAFMDQAAVAGLAPHRVLKIAYGRAAAAPEAPRLAAILDGAVGLAAGGFLPSSGTVPRDQIFAAQSFRSHASDEAVESGIGVLVANGRDEMLAPLFVPELGKDPMSMLPALQDMDILAAASGSFAGTDAAPAPALAILARPQHVSGAPLELWLVHQDPDDGHLAAVKSAGATGLTCASCVLAGVNADAKGRDELLVFDDRKLTIYAATDDGFADPKGEVLDFAVSAADATTNPARYVPRPLIVDLDGDQHLDVVLRAATGEIVAYWGTESGMFIEDKLFDTPACDAAHCAGQAVAQVRVTDSGAKMIVRVGPGVLDFHALDKRAVKDLDIEVPIAPPDPATDYVAVAAVDVDGDGVDDLAVMTSGSSLHILRGVPVHE